MDDFKVIVYIIIGIIYFIVTINKNRKAKAEEGKVTTKTVKPPVANTFEEITRELKRKQTEAQARQRQPKPQPKTVAKASTEYKGKDILVHERKSADGSGSYYDRELTNEEKQLDADNKLKDEAIYKVESIVEMEAREQQESTKEPYVFNARQAFIGSIIFERKF